MLSLDALLSFCETHQVMIIGIGLPILIFIIQLWLWIKDHRTCDITLIENRNYVLDPSLSNKVKGLDVLFRNEPIKNWLLYYQITITNSGTKDISMNEVVSPLTLSMPDNVKLMSCDVYEQSKDLTSEIEWNGNEIIIKWDLFKRGEYIRLDIVADYDSSLGEYKYDKHSLMSKITYNKSRIQDLRVQKTNIRNYEYFLRNLKTVVFMCLTLIFLSALLRHPETVKECSVIVNDQIITGQLEFSRDSVLIVGSGMVNYPITIEAVNETEKDIRDILPKGYLLLLMNIWGFVLIEQWRMRRKRLRYGLVSDKPWNQFEIEDC
jgi:hypothetical protein